MVSAIIMTIKITSKENYKKTTYCTDLKSYSCIMSSCQICYQITGGTSEVAYTLEQ